MPESPRSKNNRSQLTTRVLLVLIAGINIFIFQLYYKTVREDHNLLEQDFLGYYTAASLPRHSMYDIVRQREFQTTLLGRPYGVPAGVLLFNHPPFLVPIVRLLVDDNFIDSYRRWAAMLFAVSLICSVIIYFLMRDAEHSVLISVLSAFSALLFYPLYRGIEIGTDTAVAVLGVLLWAFFLIKSKDRAAGIALSITVIKPHLAIILAAAMFAISRRGFLMFLLGGAIITIFSVIYVGSEGTFDLVENIRLSADGEALGVYFVRQYSFMGLLARVGFSKGFVTAVGWLVFCLVTALVALCRRKAPVDLWIGFALLAGVFFAPNLHFHDLALLLLPMALIARRVKTDLAALAFFPLSPVVILTVGLTLAGYCMQAIVAMALMYYLRPRPNATA